MKRFAFAAALTLTLIMTAAPSHASEGASTVNGAFGFAFHGGISGVRTSGSTGLTGGKAGYGGGLIFETMFSNHLGIHSGVEISYFEMSGSSTKPGELFYFRVYTTVMEIPFCLITSVNTGIGSFVFLTGVTFAHTLHSRFNTSNPDVASTSGDLLPFLNGSHLGGTAGLLFKIQTSDYSDFYTGITATYYFTDLMEKMDGSIANLYNYRAVVGFLYRTDVFPIR